MPDDARNKPMHVGQSVSLFVSRIDHLRSKKGRGDAEHYDSPDRLPGKASTKSDIFGITTYAKSETGAGWQVG